MSWYQRSVRMWHKQWWFGRFLCVILDAFWSPERRDSRISAASLFVAFTHFSHFLPQRSGRMWCSQVSIIQRFRARSGRMGQKCRFSRVYFRGDASQNDRPVRRIAPGKNFAIEAHSPDPYPRPAAGGVYNKIRTLLWCFFSICFSTSWTNTINGRRRSSRRRRYSKKTSNLICFQHNI